MGLRQGGRNYQSDEAFVASGARDAERLRVWADLRPESRLIDFGCGPGRLAVGLINVGWFTGEYLGVEVQKRHVDWCTDTITSRYPSYQFVQVDARNERYSPQGSEPSKLPAADASADVFCAYSVFTHMRGSEVFSYLREVSRVLTPTGKAYVTVFAEPDVPDETENPPWFGDITWNRPLHCVLYSTDYLNRLVTQAGLCFERLIPGAGNDGQAGLVLASNPGLQSE